jgi:hypothetical protein
MGVETQDATMFLEGHAARRILLAIGLPGFEISNEI